MPPGLEKHLQACTDPTCGCRVWARNWRRRSTTLLVSPAIKELVKEAPQRVKDAAASLESESWFQWQASATQKFRGRCVVCDQLDGRGWQFATEVQCSPWQLARHARRTGHVRAVCKLLGLPKLPAPQKKTRLQNGQRPALKSSLRFSTQCKRAKVGKSRAQRCEWGAECRRVLLSIGAFSVIPSTE